MRIASHSFQTTHWSVVRHAAKHDDVAAQKALASICEAYWYPLYAYFRRSGKNAHDAEDLTQGFFTRLLKNKTLAAADPGKGRLRTFLLTCAQNFLADRYDYTTAKKRGESLLVSFDALQAEERYTSESQELQSPDRLFQRRWALTVLEQSLKTLEQEFEKRGKAATFQALRPFLGFTSQPERRYDQISAHLGIPEGTLKNQVFRLRERWRQLLFEQVAGTLENPSPEEVKAELSELLDSV
ncbi:MAG: RNA polymerase sigma factor [Chthoniobacterales bacterium]